MKTLRIGTFETNSSSCHVIQIMNTKDWEDFKAGNLLIKKEPFGEINEHQEKVVDLRGSNSDDYNWTDWFMSIDDFINDFYQNIEENRKEISDRFFRLANKNSFFEFKKQIFNYIMDTSKKEIIKNILIEAPGYEYKVNKAVINDDRDLIVKFVTPVTCTFEMYDGSLNATIYRGFTTGDVKDFLFNDFDDCKTSVLEEDSIWGKAFPDFYIYNDEDAGWSRASVIDFVGKDVKDIKMSIIDRREEC